MEFDDLFASSRWQILEQIALGFGSPVQIAEKIRTSIAYVSQQLKLLEAARIVVKKRTGAAVKGKPRTLYSIAKGVANFTILIDKFPMKRQIYPTEHQQAVLRIWALDNPKIHYPLEKMYWKLEPNLSKIKGIFVDLSAKKPKVIITSEEKRLKTLISALLKEIEEIDSEVFSEIDVKKEGLYKIFEKDSEREGKQDEVET